MSNPLIQSWGFSWAAEGRAPRTMREMRPFVERFEVVLAEDDRTLMHATRADVEAFIASHPTPPRANYCWRALRSFYKWLSEDHEVANPAAKIKAPRVPLTDVVTATEDDVNRLLRACSPWRTATACRDAAIISTLWASGMRRSELARLAVHDLDLDGMNVLIRTSKTGRPRRAPLDERAVQHLLRYLAKRAQYPVDAGDSLFVGKRGPLTGDGIRLMIQRRRAKAGVDVSAHALRRGWTVHSLGKRGISQASVMTAAGWAIGSPMAQRYTRGLSESLMLEEFGRDQNGGGRRSG